MQIAGHNCSCGGVTDSLSGQARRKKTDPESFQILARQLLGLSSGQPDLNDRSLSFKSSVQHLSLPMSPFRQQRSPSFAPMHFCPEINDFSTEQVNFHSSDIPCRGRSHHCLVSHSLAVLEPTLCSEDRSSLERNSTNPICCGIRFAMAAGGRTPPDMNTTEDQAGRQASLCCANRPTEKSRRTWQKAD
jgi:hypothetical protein